MREVETNACQSRAVYCWALPCIFSFICHPFLYTGVAVTETTDAAVADDVVKPQPAATRVHCKSSRESEQDVTSVTSPESAIRLAPLQPRNIIFPSKVFNTKKQSFRVAWFDLCPWVEWDSSAEAAFCHTCRMASQLRLISFAHCANEAFTKTGVSNWKRALKKFLIHERSIAYKKTAMKWSNYIN